MSDFERDIARRIPGYLDMRKKVAEAVSEHVVSPRIWLDTGCGTGGLVKDVIDGHLSTQFILADPSSDFLAEAKITLNGRTNCLYVNRPTDELNFGESTLDVVTAVLSHHYYDTDGRRKAVENCIRMLRKGGIFVFVEHVRPPADEIDQRIAEWKDFITSNGIPDIVADAFVSRLDKEFFPITEEEHEKLLRDCGFSEIGVFWRSCSDIGMYALKR